MFDRATARAFRDAILARRRQSRRARSVRRVPRPRAASSMRCCASPASRRQRRAVKVATWNVNSTASVRLAARARRGSSASSPTCSRCRRPRLAGRGFPGRRVRERGYSCDRSAARPATTACAHRVADRAGRRSRTASAATSSTSSGACSARRSAGVRVVQPVRAERPERRVRQVPLQARLARGAARLARRGARALSAAARRRATSTSRRTTATSTIPRAWAGQVLCTPAERAALARSLELGLRDTFRLFDQPAGQVYSWWDYRGGHVPPQPGTAHRPRARVACFKSNVHELPNRSGAARLGAAVRPCAGRRRIRAA